MGVSFDDLKIRDCVVITESLKDAVKKFFPDVKVDVVRRSVPEYFYKDEAKKLVINIIAHAQDEVNEIIKPFYWKYPQYKWVAFRPITSNLSRDEFAKALGESFATIWCDVKTDFGQSALEALAAKNIVLGKVPANNSDWIYENGNLRDNALWFFNNLDACDMIASVVQSFITNNIPDVIFDEAKKTLENYTPQKQNEELLRVYESIFALRKTELEKFLELYKEKEETEE